MKNESVLYKLDSVKKHNQIVKLEKLIQKRNQIMNSAEKLCNDYKNLALEFEKKYRVILKEKEEVEKKYRNLEDKMNEFERIPRGIRKIFGCL